MDHGNGANITGSLIASYCGTVNLNVADLAKETGLKEKYLKQLIDGKREFFRDNLVTIIGVLERKMEESGQGENFRFENKKALLESAGYGPVMGCIDTELIPPGCVGGMPIRER